MSARLAHLSAFLAAIAGLSACGTTRARALEVWYAPNLGSPDTIAMFSQPQQ